MPRAADENRCRKIEDVLEINGWVDTCIGVTPGPLLQNLSGNDFDICWHVYKLINSRLEVDVVFLGVRSLESAMILLVILDHRVYHSPVQTRLRVSELDSMFTIRVYNSL